MLLGRKAGKSFRCSPVEPQGAAAQLSAEAWKRCRPAAKSIPDELKETRWAIHSKLGGEILDRYTRDGGQNSDITNDIWQENL